MTTASISPDRLRSVLAALFAGCGMRDDDAALVSYHLVESDMRGVASHGSALAEMYLDALRSCRIDPRGRPYVAHGEAATAVVDGANAMGHVGATFAMEEAIRRARITGSGVVALRHSNHCGAVGNYARMALEVGMIGLICATSIPTMAPPGGAERLLGMNPLAVVVPTAAEPPVVLDTAFAAAARGRIVQHAQRGEPLPEGWATDTRGEPTTDPTAALDGMLTPIGGYKGAGLAVVVGLLASALGGASVGSDLGSLEEGPRWGRDGVLAIAIDPGTFGSAVTVRQRVDAAVAVLRSSAPAGDAAVLLPGDRSTQTRERADREGITLGEATRATLRQWCTELGVDAATLS